MQAPSLRRLRVLGEIDAGLYLFKPGLATSLDVSTKSLQVSSLDIHKSVCTASMTSEDIWHARLGHLPFIKLQQLGLLSNYTDIDSIKQCFICSKARQHRLSFRHSQIHTTHVFELVHIDLWGPYRVQTHNGYKYFLTIVDNYSRTTWTHLLATKSNAMILIRAFTEMAYTQFNAKVKTIRSDNALELGLNREATSYFLFKGIIYQISCVATP